MSYSCEIVYVWKPVWDLIEHIKPLAYMSNQDPHDNLHLLFIPDTAIEDADDWLSNHSSVGYPLTTALNALAQEAFQARAMGASWLLVESKNWEFPVEEKE